MGDLPDLAIVTRYAYGVEAGPNTESSVLDVSACQHWFDLLELLLVRQDDPGFTEAIQAKESSGIECVHRADKSLGCTLLFFDCGRSTEFRVCMNTRCICSQSIRQERQRSRNY